MIHGYEDCPMFNYGDTCLEDYDEWEDVDCRVCTFMSDKQDESFGNGLSHGLLFAVRQLPMLSGIANKRRSAYHVLRALEAAAREDYSEEIGERKGWEAWMIVDLMNETERAAFLQAAEDNEQKVIAAVQAVRNHGGTEYEQQAVMEEIKEEMDDWEPNLTEKGE